MKTVLVVGAGGSVAQAQGFRPTRSRGERPPLDANFFSGIDETAGRHLTVGEAAARLRTALETSGEFADPWTPTPISLEQFFADVYYEVARSRSRASFEVFVAVLDLYVRVLEETTNWMAIRPRPGELGLLLRHELDIAAADLLTVVTFNHDLVLENEVTRLPRVADTWCIEGLYGDLPLSGLNAPPSLPTFPLHDDSTCRHESPIHLLKLHGSLNWVLRTRSADPELGTLFPSQRARERVVYLHGLRQVSHYGSAITTSTGGRGRTTWYAWPLVVPPVYDKQRIIGTRLLTEVWDRARAAILDADRLVLVGYSLPDADVFARQMLRRAFSRNDGLDCVEFINPDPGVAMKAKQLFGAKVIRVYEDINSYITYSA